MLNDNWASTTRPPWTGRLGLRIVTRQKNTSVRRGYMCMCMEGHEGNPYLPGGCKGQFDPLLPHIPVFIYVDFCELVR